jgi:hypothetical protein
MGHIPRWQRLAVARGMNKGKCSFFARSARLSSGRGRISIYLETSSHLLRSSITFCPPRFIPFSSTKPANFAIESTNFNLHRQTTRKSFHPQASEVELLRSSLHFAYSLQISSISRNIPGRTVALHDAPSNRRSDRRTPLTGGRLHLEGWVMLYNPPPPVI